MDPKVLSFLANHRVSSLATLLTDGSPHAAALHYSHKNDPLELYFSTKNTSRKAQALLDRKPIKASLVVGFSEEEWITLQMDGEVKKVLDKNELKVIHDIHYKKVPHAEQYKNDPETIFLKFTPTWWRYTDYTTNPHTIFGSDKK